MSPSIPPTDYAQAVGFHSVVAPAIFVGCYVPLFLIFVWKSLKIPTHVHYTLTFFCAIRIAAFVIRTILTASDDPSLNVSLLIADETLFGVGFFGLLYSAYILVVDLEVLSERPPSKVWVIRITQNHKIFRLLLLSAVVIGVVAPSIGNGSFTNSSANALQKTSTILFLVLTILQAFQTIYYAWLEIRDPRRGADRDEAFGKRHAIFVLVLISALLLVREIFITATIDDLRKQVQESLWYPLVALPELLAVSLYTIPGLVPGKKELPR